MVDTFGTGKVSNARLEQLIRRHFDLTPAGIIKYLDLRRPIYRKTAAYGHFGRSEPEFSWERTDRVKDLRDDVGM
jgi:S-adenosylmethionine synthetase